MHGEKSPHSATATTLPQRKSPVSLFSTWVPLSCHVIPLSGGLFGSSLFQIDLTRSLSYYKFIIIRTWKMRTHRQTVLVIQQTSPDTNTNIFNEELSTDVLRTLVYFPHSLALDITLQNWGFCCQLQAMVKWLRRPSSGEEARCGPRLIILCPVFARPLIKLQASCYGLVLLLFVV